MVATSVAAVGAGTLAVGCGDDDDDASPASTATSPAASATSATTAAATTAAATEDPKRYGGTFRISQQDPHRGSDPQINGNLPAFHSAKNYSKTHIFQVSTQKVILDMATAVEQPDPTTIRYTIRPDMKFHNVAPMNGRLVKADDLRFTWQRFPDTAKVGSTINVAGYSFLDLPAATAPDNKTVVAKLKAPAADGLALMGQHYFGVVAREAVEANAGNLTNVNTAGSGPFILAQSDPATKLTYRKNPDYYSHDHSDAAWFPKNGAYFAGFENTVIKDPGTLTAQLYSGGLDGLYVNALNVDSVLAADFKAKGLQVLEAKANDHVGLGMVLDRLKDIRLRQAIQKAIDYDAFIKSIYLGNGIMGAPVGTGFPASVRLPEAQIRKYLAYDPAEAKKLWQAASGPSKLVIIGIVPYPFMEQVVTFVQQSLEKTLGVTIEVQTSDIPGWLAKVVSPTKAHDIYVWFDRAIPDTPSTNALSGYIPIGSTQTSVNYTTTSSTPEVAALAKQALDLYMKQDSALSANDRQQGIYALQQFVLENATPSIPLPAIKTQYVVANKRVKNLDTMLNDVSFWNNQITNNLYLDPATP